MFNPFLLGFLTIVEKILGIVFGLLASYKTEASFALAVGLSLMLASNQFDRCLLVVTLFFAFIEGYKIGGHPLV